MKGNYQKLPLDCLLNFKAVAGDNFLDIYLMVRKLRQQELGCFYYNTQTNTLHKSPSHPPARLGDNIIYITPTMLPHYAMWAGTTEGYFHTIKREYGKQTTKKRE